MVGRASWRLAASDSHEQGSLTKVGTQVIVHRPAADLAGRHILDRGDIQPAFASRPTGDVGEPGFILSDCFEALPQKIGRDQMAVTAVRRHRQPALLPWHDKTLLAHEPGDPLSADPAFPGAQLGMNARTASGLVALLEALPDLGYHCTCFVAPPCSFSA